MSARHPIICIVGSSGAGRPVVIGAFQHILRREHATFCPVDGGGFHIYDRAEFKQVVKKAAAAGEHISHFSPAANYFDKFEALLREYSEGGTGTHRHYIHDDATAAYSKQPPGTFTPWDQIPPDTDLMLYHGHHGCFVSEELDFARYMDLKIGVVPIMNLEWIQKIDRDTAERGYSAEAVTDTILRRMHDYVHYIMPQFSRTDINFQRVPTVDTSNPFAAREVPKLDESAVVVRVAHPDKLGVDFPRMLNVIDGSFMSRRNTIVIPGNELGFAIELLIEPLVHDLLERSRKLRRAQPSAEGLAS